MNIINHLLRVYKFLSPQIKIHRRLSRNANGGVIFHSHERDLHVNFSWSFFRQELAFILGQLSLECPGKKRKKTSCPFASSKKAKKTQIWGDQAVQRRTSEVFGSERPWAVFLTKKNG